MKRDLQLMSSNWARPWAMPIDRNRCTMAKGSTAIEGLGPAEAAPRGPSDSRAGQRTPIIEPLSLDEAYLDVTENLKAISSATQIAEEIRARIRTETELSFGRRLLQQVHGMTPDNLFVRFGSRRLPCRRKASSSWPRAGLVGAGLVE